MCTSSLPDLTHTVKHNHIDSKTETAGRGQRNRYTRTKQALARGYSRHQAYLSPTCRILQERQDDEHDDSNKESYYGQNFVKHSMERGEELSDLEISERQILSMRLYEVSLSLMRD